MLFRGNDVPGTNGKFVGHEDPFGKPYILIADKGLTREFTSVAIYGEASNDLAHYFEQYGYDEIFQKALLTSQANGRNRA